MYNKNSVVFNLRFTFWDHFFIVNCFLFLLLGPLFLLRSTSGLGSPGLLRPEDPDYADPLAITRECLTKCHAIQGYFCANLYKDRPDLDGDCPIPKTCPNVETTKVCSTIPRIVCPKIHRDPVPARPPGEPVIRVILKAVSETAKKYITGDDLGCEVVEEEKCETVPSTEECDRILENLRNLCESEFMNTMAHMTCEKGCTHSCEHNSFAIHSFYTKIETATAG